MPEDEKREGRYIVPALAQGLAVLGLFSRETPVLTAPEIVQRLLLSRTTVFRLLQTLEALGFVQRESERAYRLGSALLDRGFAYLSSLDLLDVAGPILRKLRDETGLSTHMAIRERAEIVYVARFAASSTVASSVQIGTRFPVHATAMGRMMVCDFTDAELKALYPREPLPPFTEQTPTTRAALRKLLDADRATGFTISQSFFERGVSSIAAPVRNAQGHAIAAINVTSVDHYVAPDALRGPLKDAVLTAAHAISRWLPSELANPDRRELPLPKPRSA